MSLRNELLLNSDNDMLFLTLISVAITIIAVQNTTTWNTIRRACSEVMSLLADHPTSHTIHTISL